MKKVYEITSDKLDEIKIDKNRYYLKIKNTDSIYDISKTFEKIIKNNFNNQVEISNEESGHFYTNNKLLKTIDSGVKWSGIKIKNHKYGWYAIKFQNLYKHDGNSRRWSRTLTNTRYDNNLYIEHACKDFRFEVYTEIEFPISKYLKYIKTSFEAIAVRSKQKDIKKFVSGMTWMGVFGDLLELGWENIDLTKSYDEFSYRGRLSTGRTIDITLQKNSLDEDPLFTSWMIKGQLVRNLNKSGVLKFIESLLEMGLLKGTKISNEENC